MFGAYGGVWGVTGKLIEASIQTWVSDEYDVPLRSITEWVGEDDDKVRHEYYSEGIITDNLTQGQRMNPMTDIADVRALWSDVARQILEQNLRIGVHADLPKLKSP